MRVYIYVVVFAAAARFFASFATASSAVTSSDASADQRLTSLARRFAVLKRQAALRHKGTAHRHKGALRHKGGAVRHKAALQHIGSTATADVAAVGAPNRVTGHAGVNRKSARLLSSRVAGVASKRPIITGCLKECGYKEQACVTQCQVCIEQNECRILGKCDVCLRAAHAQRVQSKKIDAGILDDGGVAMMRDGMLAEMTTAKMQALERKRELRTTREGVLKAQREAEWAAEERHAAAQTLIEERQVLKGARLEVTRWKLQNEKKLKAMRARAREQRQERQKAERKLAAAKDKYSKAEKRLEIASNDSDIEDGSSEGGKETEEERNKELQEERKLAIEVEERQQAVERAENDVEKTSADGEWLDRGLRRRVKSAQKGARDAREELLVARAHERVSRERLEDAKVHYVLARQSSQNADKAAEDAEKKLRKAPVSPNPEAQKANVTSDHKDKALRSSAYAREGATWLLLSASLVLSWA